jgi:hypothetical protein
MYDMYNLSCVCVIAFLALLSRYGLAQPFSGEIRLFSFVFFDLTAWILMAVRGRFMC